MIFRYENGETRLDRAGRYAKLALIFHCIACGFLLIAVIAHIIGWFIK